MNTVSAEAVSYDLAKFPMEDVAETEDVEEGLLVMGKSWVACRADGRARRRRRLVSFW